MTSPFRPIPVVNPPPEPGYWTVLDIAVEFNTPDSILWLQTDSPVFAYVNFSPAAPSPILRSKIVRGVSKRTGTLWRAPAGQWFSQQEGGDVFEHSWSIRGWPPGASLWYWFDAYQQGAPTVSSSILFSTVRPGGITPATSATSIRIATQPLYRLPAGSQPTLIT